MKPNFRKIHAWGGIVSASFILLLTLTGLALSFPEYFKNKPIQDMYETQYPHKILTLNSGLHIVSTDYNLYLLDQTFNKKEAISYPHNPKNIIKLLTINNDIIVVDKNGFIFKANLNDFIWDRINAPDIEYIYDASLSDFGLTLLADKGLYIQNLVGEGWQLKKEIKSTTSIHDILKGLHTGYFFKPILKTSNIASSLILVLLIITGVRLFFKKNR
jgi:hypothetical protein